MDAEEIKKPKFNLLEIFTKHFLTISAFIGLLTFVLSGTKLTILSATIIVIAVILLALFIYIIWYGICYLRFLLRIYKSYNRLIELYGKIESESLEKDNIIDLHQKQLRFASAKGFYKGQWAQINSSSPELSAIRTRQIRITGKSINDGVLSLTFDVGENEGIKDGTLLSIVTEYNDELWGVILINWVSADKSRGTPIEKINSHFWSKIEKEVYYDPTPPAGVTARLYNYADFETELGMTND
jgi:hypothetical protein